MGREGTEQWALVSEVLKPPSMLLLYLTCSHCLLPLPVPRSEEEAWIVESCCCAASLRGKAQRGLPQRPGPSLGDADTVSPSRVGRRELMTGGIPSLSESVRNM